MALGLFSGQLALQAASPTCYIDAGSLVTPGRTTTYYKAFGVARADVVAIPTSNEWGMILAALILGKWSRVTYEGDRLQASRPGVFRGLSRWGHWPTPRLKLRPAAASPADTP